MKEGKIAVVMSVFVISAVFPVFALAETNAGIKPGSPLYFFDIALEKVELFLTVDQGKKVEKILEYAEERLAEAKEAINENELGEILKVTGDYESRILLAIERAGKLNDLVKSEELLNTIFENTERHQETLLNVLDKVPDAAKEAIENAIEVSKVGNEETSRQLSELKIKAVDRALIVERFKEKLEGENDEDNEDIKIENLKTRIQKLNVGVGQFRDVLRKRSAESEVKEERLEEVSLAPLLPEVPIIVKEKVVEEAPKDVPTAIVHAPSPEIEFSAVEDSVSKATLTWSATGASSCSGNLFDTNSNVNGSVVVTISGLKEYKITCFNKEGSSTVRTVSVPAITGAPTIDFRSWSDFSGGRNTRITWDSTNSTFCDGDGFDTGGDVSGVVKVTQEETTVYTLTCTGPKGTSKAQVVATVIPKEEALGSPTISLEVVDGEVILEWSAPVVGCVISGSSDFSFITEEKEGTVNAGPVKDNTSYKIFCEAVI